ncbi:MAG: ABC transporter permease [Desulfobacteraceae bacterium]|jgi:putative ABC transport system permease protein
MLINYIKIAIRNILRNKLHSIINIMGLAMGIACAVLLLLAVREIQSYDKHHSKHERIYMVQSDFTFVGKELFNYGTSIAVGPTLKDEYPVIEDYVRIIPSSRVFFYDSKNEIIGENGICFADSSVFKILDHDFIYGSPEGALDTPNSIVLSKTLAQKYFGDENPVGKILTRNNDINYTVTGVFEDLSKNTFRHYEALMPMRDYAMFYGMENFNSRKPGTFFNCNGSHFTFILLHKNANIQSIENGFDRFHKKYIEEAKKLGNDLNLVFEPLGDVFLNFRPSREMPPIYSMTVVLLVFLTIFILVVACINYMNIVTAQSEARAKEVGVRKVMGANRLSLVRQFLCESIVMSVISLIIALVLIELSLPTLNDFTGRNLEFSVFMSPDITVGLLILILLVGFLSGSYPALFLSSFLPARVLRGSGQTGKRKGRLRKLLVILQFTLAVMVINFTFIFQEMVDFWLHADLGFHIENILIVENNSPKVRKAIPLLKEELLKNNNISTVSGSFAKVGTGSWTASLRVENSEKEMVDFHSANLGVDFNFVDMLEVELLEGRSFTGKLHRTGNLPFW